MAYTAPPSFTPTVLTSTQMNILGDDIKYLHDQVSGVAGSTSPFVASVSLIRIGDIVWARGAFSRASSFSSSFTNAGTIPVGFRPASNLVLPPSTFFSTTTTYQIGISAAGVVTIRMSAASTADMNVDGISWVAA